MTYKRKEELNLQILVEEIWDHTYIWKAEVWKERLDLVWKIMRVYEDWPNTEVAFADNDDKFIHSWENKINYDYTIN